MLPRLAHQLLESRVLPQGYEGGLGFEVIPPVPQEPTIGGGHESLQRLNPGLAIAIQRERRRVPVEVPEGRMPLFANLVVGPGDGFGEQSSPTPVAPSRHASARLT